VHKVSLFVVRCISYAIRPGTKRIERVIIQGQIVIDRMHSTFLETST
jgi:hypothetical protein